MRTGITINGWTLSQTWDYTLMGIIASAFGTPGLAGIGISLWLLGEIYEHFGFYKWHEAVGIILVCLVLFLFAVMWTAAAFGKIGFAIQKCDDEKESSS